MPEMRGPVLGLNHLRGMPSSNNGGTKKYRILMFTIWRVKETWLNCVKGVPPAKKKGRGLYKKERAACHAILLVPFGG